MLMNAEKKNSTILFQSTHCMQGSRLFVTLWAWHYDPPPLALYMLSPDTTRTLPQLQNIRLASHSLLEVAPVSFMNLLAQFIWLWAAEPIT